MRFIQRLLAKTDAAQLEFHPPVEYDDNLTDALVSAVFYETDTKPKVLAIAATTSTVDIKIKTLSAEQAYLRSTIAELTEELRQTDLALTAMRAAQAVLNADQTATSSPPLTLVE